MNFLKQYFTSQYLFQIDTAFISPREKLMFFTGGILVLVAIVVKIAAVLAPNPVDKKYRNKFYSLFLSIGLAALVWYFFRYEDVLFFGTRFVEWFIILLAAVWFVWLVVYTIMHYPKEKEIWDKEQIRQKYLPQ